MVGRPRRAWLVRLAITLLILAWVLSRRDVWSGLRSAQVAAPWWLVGAVVSGAVAAVLAAVRWHCCLRACACPRPFTTVLRISLASAAAGLLSIGPVGVDAMRVVLAANGQPASKGALLASISLDHVTALPALLVLGAVVISTLGLTTGVSRHAVEILGLVLVLSVGAGLLIRSWRPAWHQRVVYFVMLSIRSRHSAAAVAVSLPLLVAHYGAFWCAAQALALPAPAVGLFGAIVIADSIAALPITLGGIGFREKSLEVLLQRWYGVASAVSVVASLLGFLTLALVTVVGALCFPLRRVQQPLDP